MTDVPYGLLGPWNQNPALVEAVVLIRISVS